MKDQHILGIDVGASGIKGAIVDIATGELMQKRTRLEMPKESKMCFVNKLFIFYKRKIMLV